MSNIVSNREQKRKMVKLLKKKGNREYLAKRMVEFQNTNYTINEGEKVKINIKRIQLNPNYKTLSKDYRDFVETNEGVVFTVEYDESKKETPSMVCLKEQISTVKWLFFVGDLIKVREIEGE